MSTGGWIALAVGVVVLAVAAFLIIRRVRYTRALAARGWTFDSSPPLESVLDHQAPPFGLGFDRSADELISGTTAGGVAFRVFEYAYTGAGPKYDQRLASLRLPHPLPDLFITTDTPRAGITAEPVDFGPGLSVHAVDPAYARAVLSGPVMDAVRTFTRPGRVLDLSVDGDHLVSAGAPKDPEELAGYLGALAPVATALGSASAAWSVPPRPPGFHFYGRPDWVLDDRDDSLIAKYGLTTAGHNHRTEKIIRGGNDGLPLEAFVHRWQTTRTETSTDSEGRTTTRTVTENHDETVLAITLPFPWPLLSVDGGWGGQKVRFESEEFNDAFTVRTSEPKFASDVIHPRQMEYLLAVRPPGFRIEGRLMRFYPSQHDTLLIGRCADVAHGFLARVPSFVWKDLGITPPAFRG